MKKYCFIYKTTCLVTGLIYIGRHITTDLDDGYIGCGVYRQSDVDSPCSYFQNAVRKYKYENFKREILEFCKKEQLDDREQFWIRYLDSTNISIGFNMTKGGVGFCGHHSEESKNKMRERLIMILKKEFLKKYIDKLIEEHNTEVMRYSE